MMYTLQLVFGTYNSIPPGTPDEYLEDVYQNRLRPFIKCLYRFPRIKLVLHYSGFLLSWIEKHHSEFIDVLQELTKRRQVEFLGGGFYEPFFSVISKTDAIGQIELLTTYLRKTFGVRPRGCWIPETMWEPNYPSLLKSAGLDYTFLGESQFLQAGYRKEDLLLPTITEDQGKLVTVFPILEDITKDIGMCDDPSQILQSLFFLLPKKQQMISDPIPTLLWDGIGSSMNKESRDGESLEQWLEAFFKSVITHQEEGLIQTRHPSRILRTQFPKSKGYFPPTPYQVLIERFDYPKELQDQYRKIQMPGLGRYGQYYQGIFRQAMARYSEANVLYGKMQFINSLVNQIRGDKYRKQAAKEELWKGQSHVPLWQGTFGGIYNPSLRKYAYSSLISAEMLTREQGIFAPSIVKTDLDLDGIDEYLYQGNDFNAYVHVRGGSIFELDYLHQPWNYLDTFGKYPEPYHTKLERKELHFDETSRRSFVDHFFTLDQQFDYQDPPINMGKHWTELYMVQDRTTEVAKTLTLDLIHEGLVTTDQGVHIGVEIHKIFRFEKSKFSVQYTVTNNGVDTLDTLFSPEVNLSFSSPHVRDLRLFCLSQQKEELPAQSPANCTSNGVQFDDVPRKVSIKLELDKPAGIWLSPVYTSVPWKGDSISYYQGTSCFFQIPLHLEPSQSWQGTFNLRFSKLKTPY
jgi:hypothetical protein